MEYKDYYQTLGVDKLASPEDIKKAYRRLIRQYHPDVSKHSEADAKTKEINEAYGVLSDPDKRAAYDDLGRGKRAGQQFQPPPDWASAYQTNGRDPGDFFADLFAHVGRRARHGNTFQQRGDDLSATIAIDLQDAFGGALRQIVMRVPQREAGGQSTQTRTLNVTIPKGVLPGQQLRLAGQGHPGRGGGAAGDLLLEVTFNPDPRYRLEGSDVIENVPVTPWEAALGAKIAVPTPSGQVEVTVPAGSQSGRRLRLRGRGIPAAVPGDLYLVLEVVLPPANSEPARRLYEAMARELHFNPRSA